MPKQVFQRPQPVRRDNFGKPGKAGNDLPRGRDLPAGALKGQRLGKGGKPLPPKSARPAKDDVPGER